MDPVPMTDLCLAVDPGPEQSAYVLAGADGTVFEKAICSNEMLRDNLRGRIRPRPTLAIEQVESYGMPVGRDVFQTIFWSGRFVEAWDGLWAQVPRRDVKLFLCGTSRAKDGNIRQAIIDRYPRTGGGKTPQIGVKSNPGPLYGMKSHLWAALAVALTFHGEYH